MQRFAMRCLFCWLSLGAAWSNFEGAIAGEQHSEGAAEQILPGEPGRRVCYERVYDTRHLVEHRKQKITQMQFLLRVVGYDAQGDYVTRNPDHVVYEFALSLKRRGDRRALRVNGDCLGERAAHCVVDCDGGGVDIEKGAGGEGLLVRLSGEGIAFGNDCDTYRGRFVGPGEDDKDFLLAPAAPQACEKLEKEQLNPFPSN